MTFAHGILELARKAPKNARKKSAEFRFCRKSFCAFVTTVTTFAHARDGVKSMGRPEMIERRRFELEAQPRRTVAQDAYWHLAAHPRLFGSSFTTDRREIR
ncbi:MAG: hypothetical protein WBD40_10840 [Tepidisphaeraceae bacterium]